MEGSLPVVKLVHAAGVIGGIELFNVPKKKEDGIIEDDDFYHLRVGR